MEMPIFTVKLYGLLSIPFSRKKSFNRLPSVILYLALQESQPLIAQLQALLDAGAAEFLDGASYRMIGPFLYDRNTDLSLEADTGSALLI